MFLIFHDFWFSPFPREFLSLKYKNLQMNLQPVLCKVFHFGILILKVIDRLCCG